MNNYQPQRVHVDISRYRKPKAQSTRSLSPRPLALDLQVIKAKAKLYFQRRKHATRQNDLRHHLQQIAKLKKMKVRLQQQLRPK